MGLINKVGRFRVTAGWLLAVLFALGSTPISAQTIQLPAFQQRSAKTTIIVPHRGSVSLGRLSSARQSRLRVAPPLAGPLSPSRVLRNSRGTGNLQMRVWVHDLQAMDAAIHAAGRSKVANTTTNPRSKASNASASARPKPRMRLPLGN